MTPMVDVKREVEVKKEVMSSDEMLSPGLRLDQIDSQPQGNGFCLLSSGIYYALFRNIFKFTSYTVIN